MSKRGAVGAWLVVSLLGVSPGAQAAAKNAQGSKVAALFVLIRDEPDLALVDTLGQGLSSLAKRTSALTLVTGMPLAQALGEHPALAITRCGADLGCIARLGAEAKAQEVVVLRITPTESGILVNVVVVAVHAKKIVRGSQIAAGTIAEIEQSLPRVFREIFAVAPPEGLGDENDAGQGDIADLFDDAFAGEKNPAAAGTSGAGRDVLELEALPELQLTPLPPPEPPPRRKKYVLFAGIGAAGLGAGLVVLGAVLGANGQATRNGIPDDLPLSEATLRAEQAQRQVNSANALFATAAMAAVVGGAMIIIGLLDTDPVTQPSARIGPSPDRATLGLAW